VVLRNGGQLIIQGAQEVVFYKGVEFAANAQGQAGALRVTASNGSVSFLSGMFAGQNDAMSWAGISRLDLQSPQLSTQLGSLSVAGVNVVLSEAPDTLVFDEVDAGIGGAAADQQAAFSQLGLALLAAILVVYIIMVATFRSLLQPLLLLVSIPFAATGAIALQVATGVPLGVASLIGVLMLVGIVVTNAIVLIDLVNQYRVKGYAVKEAVMEGASRRLRPILMTAAATIFALIPLATGLSGSGGGFISQPLAIVVIGGLLSSTVLTLIVLPVLYAVVEGGRERSRIKRGERKDAKRAALKVAAESSAVSGSTVKPVKPVKPAKTVKPAKASTTVTTAVTGAPNASKPEAASEEASGTESGEKKPGMMKFFSSGSDEDK
jgi:multidrug efflux pump subunit AcrB